MSVLPVDNEIVVVAHDAVANDNIKADAPTASIFVLVIGNPRLHSELKA